MNSFGIYEDGEYRRLAEVLRVNGTDALVSELNSSVKDWPREKLGELLLYLSQEGGTQWPTVLCRLGADPNYKGDEGDSALSYCVHGAMTEHGQPGSDTFGTALELLSLGADPGIAYGDVSVLNLALSWNQPKMVCALLLANPNLDRIEPNGETKLRELLKSSEHDWARLLAVVIEGQHR